jgi:predicted PurR-regulated permease PerM
VKIQNAFRLGLFGGLGVLVAVAIGGGVQVLGPIITYVGAALFLALGIDPAVSWLEKRNLPRWLAILVVLVGILAVFAGLVLAIIPVIADQVGNLIGAAPDIIDAVVNDGVVEAWWNDNLAWLPYNDVVNNVQDFLQSNLEGITTGVFTKVLGIASGAFGLIIVLILTLYFVASLASIKRGLYQLIPATKREKFIDIAEQIAESVGKYVRGQVLLGLANGILTAAFMLILGLILGDQIDYWAMLAFLAFLFSLVPMV